MQKQDSYLLIGRTLLSIAFNAQQTTNHWCSMKKSTTRAGRHPARWYRASQGAHWHMTSCFDFCCKGSDGFYRHMQIFCTKIYLILRRKSKQRCFWYFLTQFFALSSFWYLTGITKTRKKDISKETNAFQQRHNKGFLWYWCHLQLWWKFWKN